MKTAARLLIALLFVVPLSAQTPAPAPATPAAIPAVPDTPSPVFSVSTQALGIHIGGQTVAGTDEVGSLNLKGSWWLQSDNVLFSSACSTCAAVSGQLYLVGPKYYSSALAKKISATNLTPYFHVGFGVARNSPASGSATQHFGLIADAGADYKVNGTFSFGPRAGLVVGPGLGPSCSAVPCPNQSPLGYFVSAELKLALGSK